MFPRGIEMEYWYETVQAVIFWIKDTLKAFDDFKNNEKIV